MNSNRGLRITYWLATGFFALWMAFTAYAQLALPQLLEVFAHLGFPDYFRIELAVAKLVGVLILLLPMPSRLKEWAYAGFAITLASALLAHLAVGEGMIVWSWPVAAGIVWAVSYITWRKTHV